MRGIALAILVFGFIYDYHKVMDDNDSGKNASGIAASILFLASIICITGGW
jgi:hypothetical protein